MICQSDADCERATRLALVAAQRAEDAEAQVRSVLRLCGLLDGAEDPWQRAMAGAIRTALEVEQ